MPAALRRPPAGLARTTSAWPVPGSGTTRSRHGSGRRRPAPGCGAGAGGGPRTPGRRRCRTSRRTCRSGPARAGGSRRPGRPPTVRSCSRRCASRGCARSAGRRPSRRSSGSAGPGTRSAAERPVPRWSTRRRLWCFRSGPYIVGVRRAGAGGRVPGAALVRHERAQREPDADPRRDEGEPDGERSLARVRGVPRPVDVAAPRVRHHAARAQSNVAHGERPTGVLDPALGEPVLVGRRATGGRHGGRAEAEGERPDDERDEQTQAHGRQHVSPRPAGEQIRPPRVPGGTPRRGRRGWAGGSRPPGRRRPGRPGSRAGARPRGTRRR